MQPSSHRPPRGANNNNSRSPLPKPQMYDQFIPAYAHDSYEDYNMRDGHSYRDEDASRIPLRGPRGFESHPSRERPHEGRYRDRWAERSRSRSRSPTYNIRSPHSREEERRPSYHQRPAQISPRPSHLGQEQQKLSSLSPRPHPHPQPPKTQQTPAIDDRTPSKPSKIPPTPANEVEAVSAGSLTDPKDTRAVSKDIHNILNECLLASQRERVCLAEKEFKKRNDEFERTKHSHEKFPASKESLTAAKLYAGNTLKEARKKLKDAEENVELLLTVFPALVNSSSSSIDRTEQIQLREEVHYLRKQLESQKKDFEAKEQTRDQKLEDLLLRFERQQKLSDEEKGSRDKQIGAWEKLLEAQKANYEKEHERLTNLVNEQKKAIEKQGQALKRESDSRSTQNNGQEKVITDLRTEVQKEANARQNSIRNTKEGFDSALGGITQKLKTLDDAVSRITSTPLSVPPEVSKKLESFEANLKSLSVELPKAQELASLQARTDTFSTDLKTLKDDVKELSRLNKANQEQMRSLNKDFMLGIQNVEDHTKARHAVCMDEITSLKVSYATLVSKTSSTKESPKSPAASITLQSIQSKMAAIEKFDIQDLENRIASCEQINTSFVKEAVHTQATDEIAKLRGLVNEQSKKLSQISDQIKKQSARQILDGRAASESRTPRSRPASASPHPNSIDLSEEVRKRLSVLEAQVALRATMDWVKEEIVNQDQAAADAIVDVYDQRFHGLDEKIASNDGRSNVAEAKIKSLEDIVGCVSKDVGIISESNKTLSSEFSAFKTRPNISSAHPQSGGVIESTFNAAISELKAVDATINQKCSDMSKNLININEVLFSQQGLMARCAGIESGYSVLENRYNNINTADIHSAMADQFGQAVFPKLESLGPLEKLVTATKLRVDELEKSAASTKDLSARPPALDHDAVDTKFTEMKRSIQDANTRDTSAHAKSNQRILELAGSIKKVESLLTSIQETQNSPNDQNESKLQELLDAQRDIKDDLENRINELTIKVDLTKQKDAELQNSQAQDIDAINRAIDLLSTDTRNLNDKFKGIHNKLTSDIQQLKQDAAEARENKPKSYPKLDASVQKTKSMSASPSLNNRIRDEYNRKPVPSPRPAANGTSKKRKYENGNNHSANSSISSNFMLNDSTRSSPFENYGNKRQKVHKPRMKPVISGDEEEDEDFIRPLRNPTVSDSDD